MPVYEFECPLCGKNLDVLRRGSIGEDSYVTPTCEGSFENPHEPTDMDKVMSTPPSGRVEGGTPKFHRSSRFGG